MTEERQALHVLHWFGTRLAAGVVIGATAGLFVGFMMAWQLRGVSLLDFAGIALLFAVFAGILGGPIASIVLCSVVRNVNPWKAWPFLSLGAGIGSFATMLVPPSTLNYGGVLVMVGATIGGTLAAIVVRWRQSTERTA